MKKIKDWCCTYLPYIIYVLSIFVFAWICYIGSDYGGDGRNIDTYNATIIDIVENNNECEYVVAVDNGTYHSFTFNKFKLDKNKSFKIILDNNETKKDKTDDITVGFVYDNVKIYL